MKIAVVGAGGIGGYYGALLARAGHDVRFLARGSHRDAIRARGLEVRDPEGSWRVSVTASDDPAELLPADFTIVAVKSYSLADVSPAILRLASSGATIVPLLNGVEAFESLVAAGVPPERVLPGIAIVSVEKSGPGVITRHSDFRSIVVGEKGGGPSARAEAFAAALREAGAPASVSENITVDLWRKFLFLTTVAATCGLSRAPVGTVREALYGPLLVDRAMRETAAVARARGVVLPEGIEEKMLAQMAALPPGFQPSFLLDVERGGPNELDILSGAIVRFGRQAGVPTPIHETVVAALSAAAAARKDRRTDSRTDASRPSSTPPVTGGAGRHPTIVTEPTKPTIDPPSPPAGDAPRMPAGAGEDPAAPRAGASGAGASISAPDRTSEGEPLPTRVLASAIPLGAALRADGPIVVPAAAARTRIVVPKHHALVRFSHWMNVPILLAMIATGLSIYWASPVFQHAPNAATGSRDYFADFGIWAARTFPAIAGKRTPAAWVYDRLGIGVYRLAQALRLHWLFAYLFMINGVLYALGLWLGRGYKALLPRSSDLKEALAMMRYYVGVIPAKLSRRPWPHPPVRSKYNALQRGAYFSMPVLGLLAVASGWAMHKPVQLHWLERLFVNYNGARIVHFGVMLVFASFVIPHVVLVAADGWDTFRSMIVGWSERIGGTHDKE